MPTNQLANASHAPRCRHIKVNGLPCGAPARHGRELCCFHDSAARRNREFVLPIIEDAASLQLALNKVLQAVVDKLIDPKTASSLLYGLQIAQANLKRLDSERRNERLDRLYPVRHQAASPAQPALPIERHESDPVPFFEDVARSLGFTDADIHGASPAAEADRPRAGSSGPPAGERFDIKACIDPLPNRYPRKVH